MGRLVSFLRAGSAARRGLAPAILSLLLIVTALPARTPAEAATCQFVLGFRTLHDLIPSVVGSCLDDETHAVNGDALQHTTNGLLVWRKADNYTAFTNGYQTWINGPFGLQTRLNTARFSWEPDVAPDNVDPRLSVAYSLAANSRFASLIANVVSQKIPIRLASLGPNVSGAFAIDRQTGQTAIFVDRSLEDGDPTDAATVLIHEATHAFDFAHLPGFGTSAGCLQTEERARLNEITFWADRFGPAGKQPPANAFEAAENAQTLLGEVSLRALLVATFTTYRSECGL